MSQVWQPYEATAEQVEAAGADPENVYDVFQKNNVLPSVKMLTFERLEPFQLVAFYKEPEMLPPGACSLPPSLPACLPACLPTCLSRLTFTSRPAQAPRRASAPGRWVRSRHLVRASSPRARSR
jgi:hypothetical protein